MFSPFLKYRPILLSQSYSTACSLQEFTLSLYNGNDVQFNASKLTNYDQDHFKIFVELATSYHLHGENDAAFVQVCKDMWTQRREWAREHLAAEAEHLASDPAKYEGGGSEWCDQARWMAGVSADHRARGWGQSD
jgi:hypothetical protein